MEVNYLAEQNKAAGKLVLAFTYQVDCVKHLDFSYCSAARVGQVTIVIADGQRAQSCGHKAQTHEQEEKHQRREKKKREREKDLMPTRIR